MELIFLHNLPDILTVKDVANILRVGTNTVYALLKNGEINSKRIGRRYIIPKKCVMDYIGSVCGTNT